MIKKIILILLAISTLSLGYSQSGTGTIKGTITDKASGEALPFVNVIMLENGTQKAGASTDFDGKYTISSLQPGTYTMKVSFVGYTNYQVNGIVVKGDKIIFQDVPLATGETRINEFIVIDYEVPLIDKDGGSSGATLTCRTSGNRRLVAGRAFFSTLWPIRPTAQLRQAVVDKD